MVVASALLPGGLVLDGKRQRDVAFREVTGRIESRLRESVASADSAPARVTEQLVTACSTIGDHEVTPQLARALCVADRQYLMLRLTSLLSADTYWLHPACAACSATFDLEVPFRGLAVREAGPGFPERDVRVGSRSVRVRVPSGGDQEAIDAIDDDDALRVLLRRCVVSVDDHPITDGFVDGLRERDIEVIDEAIDAMSPAVSTRTRVDCPDCGAEQVVEIDPYSLLHGDPEQLFEEVHSIALHYHWNEDDILGLPSERRRLYLRLIDRSRNMVT